ncbi:MAG: hypothetical protein LM555_02990 [Desulfurococcaceae archaeon]|jgi:hypothetical protein|nr:hypothetical protein [Desulfurococcaceae archaeon]
MGVACFITPLVVGVVLAVVKRLWRGAERARLDILVYLMLGGALVLVAEHAWHGEIVPWPPFLTAMKSPEDIPVVINEMTRVGGAMTLAVTGAWLLVLGLTRRIQIRVTPIKQLTTTLGTTSTQRGV